MDQVQEVKSKSDIVGIIGERIELKRAGRNFKANCPFHGERTPSFMISPELQSFKCFGCGEAGDVISFLEKYEGMDFPEALKYLADKAGVQLKEFVGKSSGEKQKLIAIHTEALKFYNYSLISHEVGKKAYEYLLNERGLKKETIEEFSLGYSPENSLLLKDYLVTKKKFLPSDIQLAGIANVRGSNFSGSERFYDRFSSRVIFPLFDHRGNPIGFAGRIWPWGRQDTAKYINSPDTQIYHKSHILYGLNVTRGFIKKKGVAIIVEGELDAISSYQAGIKNVVAIKGSALTEDQVRLLSRFAQKFILALDADLAGDAASRRGITIATNLGIEVKVARLKTFKDPDEAARNDIEGYKKALINATNVWDFFIDSTFLRYDAKKPGDVLKITKEIIPIIAEIENKILQSQYIGIVAKKLGVPVEAVGEELSKIAKKEDVKPTQDVNVPTPVYDKPRDRRAMLEDRLLSLTLRLGLEFDDLYTAPYNTRLIEAIKQLPSKKVEDVSSKLPAELKVGFDNLILSWDTDEPLDAIQKEFEIVKKELNILISKEKLNLLQREIEQLEEKGDFERLEKAKIEFAKTVKNLSSFEESQI